MLEQFTKDVIEGLGRKQKYLPSKYFYNQKGDQLFQQIMAMPEYYLTRAEMEIFQTKAQEIIAGFGMNKDQKFQLIELGAGDGTKTIELLKELVQQDYAFEYVPIDISKNALLGLEAMLTETLPKLEVSAREGTYFGVLKDLRNDEIPKVVLFLGSNLGNLSDESATQFMYELGSSLTDGDKILIGLDQIKSKEIVLPAYNDASGITRAFNLNILSRINDELDADFNIQSFNHDPEYDESSGVASSYIVSLKKQEVRIGKTNETFSFEKGERIHTEISRKYNDEVLRSILKQTDLKIDSKFQDSKEWFTDYLLVKRNLQI